MKGRSIELYLVDGHPGGMLTAEVFNWTGHVLMFPRTQLASALARPEAKRTGIYLLLGEKNGSPHAYVGESEDIPARFKSHEAGKDWWTLAALVTTAGNSLNKAHVRYLEARLVEEAKAAGSLLDNDVMPGKGSLSEAAIANMEAFMETLLMILPTLRIDTFVKPPVPDASAVASTAPIFVLQKPKIGVSAEAVMSNGLMVVRRGAIGRPWSGVPTSYKSLHDKLVASGILMRHPDYLLLIEDQGFESPSAAAAVLNGCSANGQVEWKLKGTNQTYKDWEQAQLPKEAAE